MAESDDNKRRDAMKRLREMRGKAEGKPAQMLAQPGGSDAGGRGAKLRELMQKRQAGGGAGGGGGKLREMMQKRQAGGGAGLGGGAGGGLGGGAGGGGGKFREMMKKRQAGEGGADGGAGGDRPMLRKLMEKRRAEGGGAGAGLGGGAANKDPDEMRALLRERIEKLQSKLEELDSGEEASVEDATIVEDATKSDS